jgi:predicted Zn-dependent protease
LRDDDEDGLNDEDVENGVDDDGDGSRDEDAPEAMDGSGAFDDDSDGIDDEDWIDVVAYFVSGGELRERHPDLSPINGADFTESTLAQDVTQFRVERLPAALGDRAELVDITLTLTRASGASASQHARVRAGGGR